MTRSLRASVQREQGHRGAGSKEGHITKRLERFFFLRVVGHDAGMVGYWFTKDSRTSLIPM